MCSLAILLWLRARSASFAVPGIGVGAYAAALSVVSPLQGRLIDRRGRAVVLGVSTVGWVLALAALIVAGGAGAPAWSLVLIAAGAGAAMPPFGPAVRALVGELISDRSVRESAYSLDAVMQELVWITGPLLIGAVIALASPTVAVLLTAAIGAIGAAGLLAVAPPHAGTGNVGVHWAGPFSERGLRVLILPVVFVGVGLGATEVGLPALAAHSGHPAASGVLVALWAFGSLLGGLAFAVAGHGGSLVGRYRAILVSVDVLLIPLIFARSLPSAIALSLVAGLPLAPLFTCLYALVGRLAPAGTETEAFAWTSTALTGGAALGLAGGGALSAGLGIDGPFVLAVAVTLLAAGLTWALLPVDVDRAPGLTPGRGPAHVPPPIRTPDAIHHGS
jgi:MFS family permease